MTWMSHMNESQYPPPSLIWNTLHRALPCVRRHGVWLLCSMQCTWNEWVMWMSLSISPPLIYMKHAAQSTSMRQTPWRLAAVLNSVCVKWISHVNESQPSFPLIYMKHTHRALSCVRRHGVCLLCWMQCAWKLMNHMNESQHPPPTHLYETHCAERCHASDAMASGYRAQCSVREMNESCAWVSASLPLIYMKHTAQSAVMRQTPWRLSVVLNAVYVKLISHMNESQHLSHSFIWNTLRRALSCVRRRGVCLLCSMQCAWKLMSHVNEAPRPPPPSFTWNTLRRALSCVRRHGVWLLCPMQCAWN